MNCLRISGQMPPVSLVNRFCAMGPTRMDLTSSRQSLVESGDGAKLRGVGAERTDLAQANNRSSVALGGIDIRCGFWTPRVRTDTAVRPVMEIANAGAALVEDGATN